MKSKTWIQFLGLVVLFFFETPIQAQPVPYNYIFERLVRKHMQDSLKRIDKELGIVRCDPFAFDLNKYEDICDPNVCGWYAIRCVALGQPADFCQDFPIPYWPTFKSNKERIEFRKGCYKRVDDYYSKYSIWKDLDKVKRWEKVKEYSVKYGDHFRVNPNLISCIASRETGGTLEPLIISRSACIYNQTTQIGMGQLTHKTFSESYIKNHNFRSQIEKFTNSKYYEDTGDGFFRLYNEITTSPELQIELIAFHITLLKGSDRARARDYNGNSKYKEAYANAVSSCITCLNRSTIKGTSEKEAECLR